MRKLICILLLTLCIAVPAGAALTNVSEGKSATASGSWGGTNPAKAVDGVTDLGHPNHWHSASGDRSPWWMVDLGGVHLIKEVVLWNRIGCCQDRLQDITVEILDPAQDVGYESSLLNPGDELNGPATITLTLSVPVVGQYVRVSRTPSAPSGGDNTYLFALAEVQVFATDEGVSQAWGPLPSLGAVDVALDTTLLWNTSVVANPANPDELIPNPDVIRHIVYLSQDSSEPNDFVEIAQIDAGDPVEATGQTGALALVRDAVYYWRVDEIITDSNSNEVPITGSVWSFAAASSRPVVGPVDPAELLIDPGEAIAYTVSAINPITGDGTGLSYEWFKVDAAGDIPVGDNSATFAIADPNENHEGLYYCKVTTDSTGLSTNSSQSLLIIKRLMHHWPFEGTMEDVVGGFDGVAVGDPDLSVEGVSGNYAVDLDENDAIYIGQGDGLVYKFSISAWISHRGLPNNFQSVIHQDGWTRHSMHWHLRSDKSFSWGINGAGGDGRTDAGVIAESERWYHLVISYDNGLARAYIDGELLQEVMATNPIPIRFLPGTIGAWNNGGNYSRFLNGKVDDVRIYNYPVDSIDLARLYNEATGEKVCVQELKPEFDFNNDCVTDLKDVALLASNWMGCNRAPSSQCE